MLLHNFSRFSHFSKLMQLHLKSILACKKYAFMYEKWLKGIFYVIMIGTLVTRVNWTYQTLKKSSKPISNHVWIFVGVKTSLVKTERQRYCPSIMILRGHFTIDFRHFGSKHVCMKSKWNVQAEVKWWSFNSHIEGAPNWIELKIGLEDFF